MRAPVKDHLWCRNIGVCAALVPFALVAMLTPAVSRTLAVGPAHALHLPSEAAAQAADGDRIEIDPGTYADCAVWRANRLIVTGKGGEVVLRDRICQGKAIFVTVGAGITIANLTLAHARAPEHNGAGIRAEGSNLTVQGVRFIDNENGILAAPAPGSTILVRDSLFRGNGICAPVCAHGIYVNEVALLRITHSRFSDTHIGHHVKSRAWRTELVGDTITDGPDGTASYLVDVPNGGSLLMQDNVLEKGKLSDNPGTAVMIGAEGVTHPDGEIRITGNRFRNDLPQPTVFVRNLSSANAVLRGNVLEGPVVALEGRGTVE